MKMLIENNKLPAIKEAGSQFVSLCNVVDAYKQSEEIRKLEFQFKLSDNYRLELETNKFIKEIKYETSIAIKNIKLDIEKENNICARINYAFKCIINSQLRENIKLCFIFLQLLDKYYLSFLKMKSPCPKNMLCIFLGRLD